MCLYLFDWFLRINKLLNISGNKVDFVRLLSPVMTTSSCVFVSVFFCVLQKYCTLCCLSDAPLFYSKSFVLTLSRSVRLQSSEAAPAGPLPVYLVFSPSTLCHSSPLVQRMHTPALWHWRNLDQTERLLICAWFHRVNLSRQCKRLKTL